MNESLEDPKLMRRGRRALAFTGVFGLLLAVGSVLLCVFSAAMTVIFVFATPGFVLDEMALGVLSAFFGVTATAMTLTSVLGGGAAIGALHATAETVGSGDAFAEGAQLGARTVAEQVANANNPTPKLDVAEVVGSMPRATPGSLRLAADGELVAT